MVVKILEKMDDNVLSSVSKQPSERELKASRPGNLAFEASNRKIFLELLALVFSGLAYASIFPPLNLSFLAWCALVPLYWIVRKKPVSTAFRYGFVWGYAFSCSSYFWLREIEFFIPFALAFVLALFPACWCFCIPFFRRYLLVPPEIQLRGHEEEAMFIESGGPQWWRELLLAFSLSALWCILEWIRTWIATGFPWNLIAVSQWKNIALIQICEFTGIYGLSIVIVFFNMSLVLAIATWKRAIKSGKYRRPVPIMIAVILIMLCVLLGSWSMFRTLKHSERVPFNVALIQADIPQCRIPTQEQAYEALNKYMHLSDLAVTSKPDLIVWPETAVPTPYRSNCEVGREFRKRILAFVEEHRVPLLIGTIDFGDIPGVKIAPEEIPIHNSSVLIGSNGEILDRYHKIHIVPFGEYTPFSKYVPWLVKLIGMGRDLTPGKSYTIFKIGDYVRAGVNICYEDIFPEISRKLVLSGANLLVIQTNDAWYPTSSEPEQHLAHAVFRAVENRRPILRCGNNSGSCLINPTGAIVDAISFKNDPRTGAEIPAPEMKTSGFGIMTVNIESFPRNTFFTIYGNWFIGLLSVLLWLCFLYAYSSWRSKKQMLLGKSDLI